VDSTAADGEERFPGGRASTAGGDERRMREGGLRADAAGFRPGQSEHWMSGLKGEWEGDESEKRRS
jgi:hypothetical protein